MTDTSETTVRSSSGGNEGAAGALPAALVALRAATAERHELLHEIMPLSVDSVALRDYLAHLQILRDWLEPLEAWLGTFSDGPQSPLLPARINRLALIDADLAHESALPQERAASAAWNAHRWQGGASAAYRWGVCYVIEGSQLGGAVLYARLKDRLAPHPLGFLQAGRESLAARWQAFHRAMAAEVAHSTLIDEACRGAADAFDRLIELARRPVTAACANAD
ncbi:biliverdin-producing heme oxygenase [Paraburkholderia phytofirmans]|uniref:Haem oxygenase-like protein n=1 Tax=Paraburkholderia phytofirmans (strain DSM 17436 / LMG 22146 / PsJN) TaxID=398527 RepID=B2T285_PARPJ|nr:biliverdin-producing heme oxygenase [Paraburkholderia phytofirmans]ACD15696.1 Haem oxygenase-like protein [Paraburkholderia phytofirmans PsJN]